MSTPTRIAITGAAGRMGRTLVQASHELEDVRLCGAVEAPGNPCLGQDAGLLAGVGDIGVSIGDSVKGVSQNGVVGTTHPGQFHCRGSA